MAPAAQELRAALAALQPPLQPLRTPLLCGWSVRALTEPADVAEALVQGVTAPVLWGPCLELALREAEQLGQQGGGEGGAGGGAGPAKAHFLEFGPGNGTLGALVRQCAPLGRAAVATHCVGEMGDVKSFF